MDIHLLRLLKTHTHLQLEVHTPLLPQVLEIVTNLEEGHLLLGQALPKISLRHPQEAANLTVDTLPQLTLDLLQDIVVQQVLVLQVQVMVHLDLLLKLQMATGLLRRTTNPQKLSLTKQISNETLQEMEQIDKTSQT